MNIVNLITTIALLNNVDPILALSIAKTESNLNPNMLGKVGEIGLFQVRPQYYKQYTKKQLFDLKTNINVGIHHLKYSINHCKHKRKFDSVLCYNLGVTGASRIKYPSLHKYVKLVKGNYEQLQIKR